MSFVDSLKKGLFGSEDDYDDQYMDDGPQMVNNNSGLGVAGNEEEDEPEEGAATAEYAVVLVAATGFAAVLVAILKSDAIKTLLTNIIKQALKVG